MVKPGTPKVWRRVWPELRKHRPDAMLKEKERKTRRGFMLAVDMGVRRQGGFQCSTGNPLMPCRLRSQEFRVATIRADSHTSGPAKGKSRKK